jgi:hypothetical protein
MLTQSGDCEDVAAWLMSALNRVKMHNWCDGCMDTHIAINLLLKADAGSVEGHSPSSVERKELKKMRETLKDEYEGNFHVPGLVVNEQYLRSLLKGESYSDADTFIAEGTALVYSVFTKHVPGLDDHIALRKTVSSRHLRDVVAFSGVGEATDQSLNIYHTLIEIMINPEMQTSFMKSGFDSTIYLTCYKDAEGELSYPVTFADFVDPQPSQMVCLENLMTIEKEDIEIYDKIMFYEPPRLCFDDVVEDLKKDGPVGNFGFISSDQDVGDMECLDMGVFKIVFGDMTAS